MSWNDYVTNMTAKGAIQCGVYTRQGAVCAQSPGFDVSPAEIAYIIAAMNGGSNDKIVISGSGCTMIAFDKAESTLMAKTREPIYQESKVLYHAECTKLYMIICGKNGAAERNACTIGHDIGDHLRKLDQ